MNPLTVSHSYRHIQIDPLEVTECGAIPIKMSSNIAATFNKRSVVLCSYAMLAFSSGVEQGQQQNLYVRLSTLTR